MYYRKKGRLSIERALFRVVGIYCNTCKPIIEKQLKDEKAVKKIDIDMIDSIIVEYDPLVLTKEQIKIDWKSQVINLLEQQFPDNVLKAIHHLDV
jgi:copper chaperone